MITEDALRDLLREAVEAIEPPAVGEEFLERLDTDTAFAEVHRPTRRRNLLAAAAAVLVLMAGIGMLDALSGGGAGDDADDTGLASGPVTTTVPFDAEESSDGSLDSGYASGGSSSVGTGTTGGGAGGAVAPSPAMPAQVGTPVAPAQPRVVKTGSLDIEVEPGSFGDAVERITSLATGMGGFVAESTTTESDAPSGSVTVRVPSESFEQLVTQVRELGEVRQVTVKGTDVTAQFTDLAARLSALVATRDRLHTVLAEARTVGDIIAVQDRITGVQTEIEQLQGQQRLLEDQAGFGTLSITVGEPGAEIASAEPADDGGLGGAWRDARRRFGDGIEWLVGATGPLALVLLVVAALGVVGRIAWRLWRRRLL